MTTDAHPDVQPPTWSPTRRPGHKRRRSTRWGSTDCMRQSNCGSDEFMATAFGQTLLALCLPPPWTR